LPDLFSCCPTAIFAAARYSEITVQTKGRIMNLSLSIGPIASLIAGILILLIPRLLNYIVAIYLILIGLVGLFGSGHMRL